jgi:hypothetical protein
MGKDTFVRSTSNDSIFRNFIQKENRFGTSHFRIITDKKATDEVVPSFCGVGIVTQYQMWKIFALVTCWVIEIRKAAKGCERMRR